MAQRIEFEGVIHEFPDDFTPEEISAALSPPEPTGPFKSSNAMGPKAYTGPSYGPNNPLPGMGRAMRLGAEGTVSGLSKLAGAPVDLVAMLGNAPFHAFNIPAKLLGYEGVNAPFQDPVGGSQWIERQNTNAVNLIASGYQPIASKDMDGGEKMVRAAYDFGVPAAGGATTLARAAATRAPSQTPSMGDAFLRTYTQSPGKAYGQDLAAGVGGGEGALLVKENLPESYQNTPAGAVAEFGGSLVGGVGGATATTIPAYTGRVARALTKPVTEPVEHLIGGAMPGSADAGTGYLPGERSVLQRAGDSVSRLGALLRSTFAPEGIPYDPQAPLMPIPERAVANAAEFLQGRASNLDSARRAISENAQLFAENNLPLPTLGAISEDPGLLGVEQTLRRTAPDAAFVEKDNALRNAATDRVSGIRPEVPEDDMRLPQQYAKDEAERQTAQARAKVDEASRAVDRNAVAQQQVANEATAIAAPAVAQRSETAAAQASRQLDTQVKGALDERTTMRKEAYGAIDPDSTVEVDAAPLRATVAKMRDETGALSPGAIPEDLAKRLNALSGKQAGPMAALTGEQATPDKPVTLRDLVDVRKHLAAAIEQAKIKGNFDLADNIAELKQQINDTIRKHPNSAEAIEIDRERYMPFFGQGKGREYRNSVQRDSNTPAGPEARQKLPPESVAAFWLEDNEASAAHLARIIEIAPDPASAQQAVRNYMIGDLARRAVVDGKLNPVATRLWLEDVRGKLSAKGYGPLYNEFEQLQRDVLNNSKRSDALRGEVEALQANVRKAKNNAKDVETAINNGALGLFIKTNPRNAAKAVLADTGDPLARAAEVNKMIAGAPPVMQDRLRDAWQAAVTDFLRDEVSSTSTLPGMESPTLRFQKLTKQLDRNDEVLAEVFKGQPDKLKALRQSRMALEPLMRLMQQNIPGSVTREASEQVKNMQLALEAGLKLRYGVLKGGGYWRGLKIAAASIAGDDTPATLRLLQRAFTEDPRLMQQLLNRKLKAPNPGFNRRLNATVGAVNASTEDEEDKPSRKELRIEIRPDANQR